MDNYERSEYVHVIDFFTTGREGIGKTLTGEIWRYMDKTVTGREHFTNNRGLGTSYHIIAQYKTEGDYINIDQRLKFCELLEVLKAYDKTYDLTEILDFLGTL